MDAIGRNAAKAETFLIVIAALCLIGAAVAIVVQYTEPVTALVTSKQEEPARVPLPAGPRRFQ
jgi:hypothetical protein